MNFFEPPVLSTLTAEDLCALPDDGIDRELIRGELRERPVRFHTPIHGVAHATIGWLLQRWSRQQPLRKGMAVGNAGFRLNRDPLTLVGIDVAYVSPEIPAFNSGGRGFFDGPPVLAVEILSPWDTVGDIVDRVQVSVEAGAVIWVVDPYFRVVTVHGAGKPVMALSDGQELDADAYLPGFRIGVAELFDSP